MRYRLLGSTGIKVSELCLGTMTFGGGQTIGGIGQDTVNDLVAKALEAGVNFFDTANNYSGGDAERMLGRALGSRRKDVLIATKVRLKTGKKGINDVGLSRAHILDAVEASLERLGTDYIDLYQVHITDALTPLEETLRALEDLVRWGKVRYVGCCNYPAWQIVKALAISKAHDWSRFVSLQAHYSIASRDLERELMPMVKDQKLGLFIWSPLAGGLLSGKFSRDGEGPKGSRRASFDFPPIDKERAFRVLEVMREIASKHDVSVTRIALGWLLHQDAVTSVIVGAKQLDQLEDNLRAAEVTLCEQELMRLDEVSALPKEYPGWMLDWPWDDRVK
jgi:aryl-alcohol dehydrogenase-like predicted oxidoreductase